MPPYLFYGVIYMASNSLVQDCYGGTIPFGKGKIGEDHWGSLNPHLIVKIQAQNNIKSGGTGTIIQGVFVGDPTLDINLNWQSPFESSGAEAKAPALMSMLQSGAFQPLIDSLGGTAQKIFGDTVAEAKGRTGITKLNSTQVFSGMPPIKLQGSILLRAWSNPTQEVEQPMDQLIKWSLPYLLANEGTMLSNLINYSKGNNDKTLIQALMPSIAPTLVSITYKGRTYSPMVIEHISLPIGSPSNVDGQYTQMLIQVTFSSLKALDGSDWEKFKPALAQLTNA